MVLLQDTVEMDLQVDQVAVVQEQDQMHLNQVLLETHPLLVLLKEILEELVETQLLIMPLVVEVVAVLLVLLCQIPQEVVELVVLVYK